MTRHLTVRRLAAVAASLGFVVAVLAAAGWMRAAAVTAGLALATLALVQWRAQVELSRLAGPAHATLAAVERLSARVETSERRLVTAVETLRRDASTQEAAPPTSG